MRATAKTWPPKIAAKPVNHRGKDHHFFSLSSFIQKRMSSLQQEAQENIDPRTRTIANLTYRIIGTSSYEADASEEPACNAAPWA